MQAIITFFPLALFAILNWAYAVAQSTSFCFGFLFCFRYVRLVVHIISYLFLYRPAPIPLTLTLRRSDVTVIVPTVDPLNDDLRECLTTILQNSPSALIIVTVGKIKERTCTCIVNELQSHYPCTKLTVLSTSIANKRLQICAALPHVETKITLLADDHVFWGPEFLPAVLAPFEDPRVGCVGTSKRVRRESSGFSLRSFFNLLGCLYLLRHNFELAAANSIDGGVFVVSGRTSAVRTPILQDPEFIQGFVNERFFFKAFGPLTADDDNYLTRWLVKNHWRVKFQHCEAATLETTLGSYPKYLSQCLRWARTTWRSNSCSLFTDRTVWRSQPWCVYAVYMSSFLNFALFYDAALLYTLHHTTFGHSGSVMWAMAAWIFASKMVKLMPHFWRHPQDLVFIPGYLAFAYFHSLLKLWALITFWDVKWGGRNLQAVANEVAANEVSIPNAPAGEDDAASLPSESSSISSDPWEIDSGSEVEVASTSSSIRWRHSSPNDRSSIGTPWGTVLRTNPLFQPANVLESQSPIPLTTFGKTVRRNPSSQSTSVSAEPSPMKTFQESHTNAEATMKGKLQLQERRWTRGADCRRQHDGNCLLGSRHTCKIADVRDVQWNGR